MELEELKRECKRFFWCETISDCQALLDIYIDFLFQVVDKHHNEGVNDYAEADAKILIQMMMTKALHIKNVLNGVSYISTTGKKLNNIIDVTILASLIRNIYETTGMFNLIFRVTNDKYERQIIYFLWVHAGLSYRQRFDSVLTSDENKEKAEYEKKQMESIVLAIEDNPIFQKLDEKNQGKIRTKLKERDYLLRFQDNQVEFLSWRELVKTMEIREDKLNHIYSYFSLYSHPSNVSVFQYANMYKKGEESYSTLSIFNMRVAFYMLSVFIADYINLFPNTLKTYESMGMVEQIVINFHNSQARGHEYDINDLWKTTG